MTPRDVTDEDRNDELDEEFLRQLELRAELIVARLSLGHWQRRVRELERQLPLESPLRRRGADGDAYGSPL